MSQTGGELERLPGSTPVPYVQGQRSGDIGNIIDWPEFVAWARNRGIVLFGLVLIAAQLIWKSIFLSHYYFYQDDFHFMELALGHPFTWSYLTLIGAGHLFPGVYAICWVVARIALYNWAFAAAITIVMLAAASLAALRLLRTLFGSRPAILVLLLIYLLCPLVMMDTRWWSAAIELLPLQLAIFMALNAQVHYVRTGRFRHAIAVAAWLAVGLIFNEKALILPLLLFAISSGFLMEGPWPRTVVRCLVKYWRSWAVEAAMLAGYAVMFALSLHTSTVQPKIPDTAAGVFTLSWELVKDTFVPGAIGGPWQWFPTSDGQYASSAPPPALAWLSLIVAAAVILASVWSRRYAWRAWAILGGWLLAADVAPVVVGRIAEMTPGVLALQTRYVADAVPVLAICVGLAFLPLTGQPDTARRRPLGADGGQTARLIAAGLVGAFVIGSVWSVQDLQNTTSGQMSQVYVQNAEAAVAQAPAGTVIADSMVPSAIMIGAFGAYARTSMVIGPLESAGDAARIRWTSRPDGTIDHLMVFGPDGRLYQAAMYGPVSVPFPAKRGCQRVRHGKAVVQFTAPTYPGAGVLRVAYLASGTVNGDDVTVTYGRSTQVLTVKAGLHAAYFPVRGTVQSVTVSGISGAAVTGLCVGAMQAGLIVPSSSGLVIPAAS